MKTRYYEVAGHVVGVTAEDDIFALMTNYEPFAVSEERQEDVSVATQLFCEQGSVPPMRTEEMRQEDEGQVIVCGRTAERRPVYEFGWWGETAGWLVCATDYSEGHDHW